MADNVPYYAVRGMDKVMRIPFRVLVFPAEESFFHELYVKVKFCWLLPKHGPILLFESGTFSWDPRDSERLDNLSGDLIRWLEVSGVSFDVQITTVQFILNSVSTTEAIDVRKVNVKLEMGHVIVDEDEEMSSDDDEEEEPSMQEDSYEDEEGELAELSMEDSYEDEEGELAELSMEEDSYEDDEGSFDDDEREITELSMQEDSSRRTRACREAVEALEKVVIKDGEREESCAVCLEGLSLGLEATKMPCSHVFHGDCIVGWLDVQRFCPLCRFELPYDDELMEC